MIYNLFGLAEVQIFAIVFSNDVIVTSYVIFWKFCFVVWYALSSTITVESFIGLTLMVPEIMRGSLKTPPLDL